MIEIATRLAHAIFSSMIRAVYGLVPKFPKIVRATRTSVPTIHKLSPIRGLSTSPKLHLKPSENRRNDINNQEPQLQMTFTCTANDCNHRSQHTFSRRSYQSGIVILTCPSCKNR